MVRQLCTNPDDTEICSHYFEVKNLLESILNCSLSEQLSTRPVPLIFPPELVNDLSQYGYLGSPSPPHSLKASFLENGSKVLVTWRQRHEKDSASKSTQRREDIVKFVIQRGVTDLTSVPNHATQASESVSTASVPASVSVDRDNIEEIDIPDDTPQGFIHFESIGEVYFDPSTTLSDKNLPSYSKPTLASQRSHDTESPHYSSETTLGIPPFAFSDPVDAVESFEESKGDRKFETPEQHSQHSFEFDTFDYPLKLLHFRVKSINRDGKNLCIAF